MGTISSHSFTTVPNPDEESRRIMNKFGITFKNDDGINTNYDLPFGWSVVMYFPGNSTAYHILSHFIN